MNIHTLALLAALMLCPNTVRGQDMIGTDFFGNVYKIASSSGGGSLINSSGVNSMNAMARRSDGALFMAGSGPSGGSGSSTVYMMNPVTGQGTAVVTIPLGSIRGLAFGPGDVLYAVNDPLSPMAGPDDLHVIDLGTAQAPLIGPIGFSGVTALTYGKGALWAWECGSGGGTGVGLINIDVGTGAGSDVNPSVNGTCGEIQTLVFAPNGFLYGCNTSLYFVEPLTGVASQVGFTPAVFGLRGLEFVEKPGPDVYCTAKTTSCGSTPTIAGPAFSVSQSLASSGSFDVTAGSVPTGGNLGILVYTTGGALATPINGPFGFLCITPGPGFFRVLPAVTPGAGSGCDSFYSFDFGGYLATQMQDAALQQAHLPRLVDLQAWYRDPPNLNGANLTNAMTISVIP